MMNWCSNFYEKSPVWHQQGDLNLDEMQFAVNLPFNQLICKRWTLGNVLRFLLMILHFNILRNDGKCKRNPPRKAQKIILRFIDQFSMKT